MVGGLGTYRYERMASNRGKPSLLRGGNRRLDRRKARSRVILRRVRNRKRRASVDSAELEYSDYPSSRYTRCYET